MALLTEIGFGANVAPVDVLTVYGVRVPTKVNILLDVLKGQAKITFCSSYACVYEPSRYR